MDDTGIMIDEGDLQIMELVTEITEAGVVLDNDGQEISKCPDVSNSPPLPVRARRIEDDFPSAGMTDYQDGICVRSVGNPKVYYRKLLRNLYRREEPEEDTWYTKYYTEKPQEFGNKPKKRHEETDVTIKIMDEPRKVKQKKTRMKAIQPVKRYSTRTGRQIKGSKRNDVFKQMNSRTAVSFSERINSTENQEELSPDQTSDVSHLGQLPCSVDQETVLDNGKLIDSDLNKRPKRMLQSSITYFESDGDYSNGSDQNDSVEFQDPWKVNDSILESVPIVNIKVENTESKSDIKRGLRARVNFHSKDICDTFMPITEHESLKPEISLNLTHLESNKKESSQKGGQSFQKQTNHSKIDTGKNDKKHRKKKNKTMKRKKRKVKKGMPDLKYNSGRARPDKVSKTEMECLDDELPILGASLLEKINQGDVVVTNEHDTVGFEQESDISQQEINTDTSALLDIMVGGVKKSDSVGEEEKNWSDNTENYSDGNVDQNCYLALRSNDDTNEIDLHDTPKKLKSKISFVKSDSKPKLSEKGHQKVKNKPLKSTTALNSAIATTNSLFQRSKHKRGKSRALCNGENVGVNTENSYSRLLKHESIEEVKLKTDTTNDVFNCVKCKVKFKTSEEKARHNAWNHSHLSKRLKAGALNFEDLVNCDTCNKYYESLRLLKKHLREHTTNKQYHCVCSDHPVFYSMKLVRQHRLSCTAWKERTKPVKKTEWICRFCAKSFSSAGSIANHERYVHSDPQLPCPLCKAVFKQKSSLLIHLKSEQDRPSKCQLQSLAFKDRPATEVTASRHHSENSMFNQPAYPVVQSESSVLELYSNLQNTEYGLWSNSQPHLHKVESVDNFKTVLPQLEKPLNEGGLFEFSKTTYQCPFCDFCCEDGIIMKDHVLTDHKMKTMISYKKRDKGTSGTDRNLCVHCGKVLSSKQALRYHMAKHSNSVVKVCELCGKGFSGEDAYAAHKRRKHLILKRGGQKKPDYKSKIPCNICQKEVSKAQMRNHMDLHNNVYRYECQVCNKKCRKKYDLEVHTRIHTGEKPFKCPSCDKAFADQANLSHHVKKYGH